ncbi:MAG: pseudouridine synthase [Bacteroidetes bacterium]|uniref:Pseudouridine synthase n=1 Tax=Candidatus Cryptobacteroides faecavium TaxID=2840762 RepID=A0A9D9IFP5_9BACT|nr:pseudouridine synthase [Candidatus Cryptobacteroides faecavium]
MKNYNDEGFDSLSGNRRDYGSERNSDKNYTGGYSQAGRKLRHRKNYTGGQQDSDNGYQDSRKSMFSGERRNQYGSPDRRGHSSRFQDGGSRGSGSRDFGERQERSGFGNRRPSQRRSYGEGEGRPDFGGNEGRRFSGAGDDRRNYRGSRPAGKRNFGGDARKGAPAGRGRKPGAPAGKGFSKRQPDGATAGINRMLSRKPQLDDTRYSDNDMINIPVKEEVRLNKFIANSGVCSRREADNLILAGVVTVNGKIVTELGTKVNIYNDEVKFNGERLKGEEKVYIVMNKPKGFVTTASDPHADKTVMDLMKGCNARVFPVGRLDKNTTGVLMFTNDGEIAEKLTHPSYDKKKIYQVTLDKDLKQEDYDRITSGIELSDGLISADELEYIDDTDHRKLGIEIHSGKNRIVRRIFESLGYNVKALDRVYFAGLTKKGLKRGAWRYLTTGEVNVLKMGAYV